MDSQTIIVPGGAGFIGCNYVRYLLDHTSYRVVVYDNLTYAGHLSSLEGFKENERFTFLKKDIGDRQAVRRAFETHHPRALVNFAAETHVDRSIDGPESFIRTNVVGTFVLLDEARRYFDRLNERDRKGFRFLHVSTDEVYGSLGESGLFSEDSPYAPNSPYSASKAGGDHLVRAYFETYHLPTLITNCSNNYGPYQFPEKLIPLVLLNAIEGKRLPIYGDGGNVRDWIYVQDHCEGVLSVLERGRLGEKYNIGAGEERPNIGVVDQLCDLLEEVVPASGNEKLKGTGIKSYRDLKTFVNDRPGHDRRYAINSSKVRTELGWRPRHPLREGLAKTIDWYLTHRAWCEEVQSGGYRRERLGLGERS